MIKIELSVRHGVLDDGLRGNGGAAGKWIGGGIGHGCDFSGGCEEKEPETGGAVP